jgi:hypothetical protein
VPALTLTTARHLPRSLTRVLFTPIVVLAVVVALVAILFPISVPHDLSLPFDECDLPRPCGSGPCSSIVRTTQGRAQTRW